MSIQSIDYLLEDLERIKERHRFAEIKVINQLLDEGFNFIVTRLKGSKTKVLFLETSSGHRFETVYVGTEEIKSIAEDKGALSQVLFKV